MHTLLLCDTPDSEGQAYGRSIRYPPFLRKCTLNITVCKWNVESMNFQGSRFMRLSQHNKSDCVCAERVWALPVPVPPPEHKPVVGDPWLFWFSYLLILVGGIGPFPTVINEAQEKKKKRDGFVSALCLQFKNDLHHVPNVWFISFALLPFRNLSSGSRWKWIDMSPNNKRLESDSRPYVCLHHLFFSQYQNVILIYIYVLLDVFVKAINRF